MSTATTREKSLHCVVVTPERTLFDEQVDFVALPLFDGELGVLPGHSPMIGRLGYGELRTRSATAVRHYFIDGGIVQVRDNVVTVLTSRAIPATQLERVAIERELDSIRSKPTGSDFSRDEKTRAMDRSRAQLRVAAKA
jgi:F-type H+-transporting ATPase subunit epsilon